MLTALPIFPVAALSQYLFGPLLFVISLFMILVILVQRGKGGGLTGALGGPGGQSVFGSKAGDLFTRITVVLAAVWIFLLAFTVWWYNEDSLSSALAGTEENVPSMTAKPSFTEKTAPEAGIVVPNVGEVAPVGMGAGNAGTADMVKALEGATDTATQPASPTKSAQATSTATDTPAEKAAEKTPEASTKPEVPTGETSKGEAPKVQTSSVAPEVTPAAPILEVTLTPTK